MGSWIAINARIGRAVAGRHPFVHGEVTGFIVGVEESDGMMS